MYSILEGSARLVLVFVSLVGFVVFDMVYVVAVLNYAAQSEMNIKLLHAIKAMAEQKLYPELEATIKVG